MIITSHVGLRKSYLFLYFILVGLRSWPLNANDLDGVVSHKSAKIQRKKKMRSRSTVFPRYFLAFAFETSLCKCIILTSASFHLKLRAYAGGIVFGEINKI